MTDNIEYFYRGPNRTTTYQSLYAAAVLLLTQDKQEFIAAYHMPTHDTGGGATCWEAVTHEWKYAHQKRKRKL